MIQDQHKIKFIIQELNNKKDIWENVHIPTYIAP